MTGQREMLLQAGAQRMLQGVLHKTLCCIIPIAYISMGIVGITYLTWYNFFIKLCALIIIARVGCNQNNIVGVVCVSSVYRSVVLCASPAVLPSASFFSGCSSCLVGGWVFSLFQR